MPFSPAHAQLTPAAMADLFSVEVERRLTLPDSAWLSYAQRTEAALRQSVAVSDGEYLVTVDRHPLVQALMLFWRSADGAYRLIGASPVSTGIAGRYDHFETPLGVFRHTPSNPDFRAEGTLNANGIRGYGRKGMRVFDFGWVRAPKGWGDRQTIDMRLQMHATDPDRLEARLGTAQSKGCIRISASLNRFLDHYGILDAEYESAAASAPYKHWLLRPDRQTVPGAGRYLVVLESQADERPAWSPKPSTSLRRIALAQTC